MPDVDVLARSVTREDYPNDPRKGVLHFFMPTWGLGMAPDLPPFWSAQRDAVLLGTMYRESNWRNAVYTAVSKKITQDWEIKSDIPLRAKRAQSLFLEMENGKGWVSGMSRHLQSFLMTGNGGAVEIVRASQSGVSKIIGLIPLDPLRTLRTGDEDIPLLYRDRRGNLHEMPADNCFIISDMPDTQELWYGVGHCAAERAYDKIITMEGLERYLQEKLTGKRPLALHIINGVSIAQLQQAFKTAAEDSQSTGMANYMGAAIAAITDPTSTPGIVTIPLAELPDGFNAVEERREAKLVYAAALGIDPQELDPSLIARGALGTGAQSMVLDDKEQGKGLFGWDKAWVYAVNYNVLDDATSFLFKESDLRDKTSQQTINTAVASELGTYVLNGILTPAQALQVAVDRDILPKEFLEVDATPDDDLMDTEKPDMEQPEQPIEPQMATPPVDPAQPQQPPAPPPQPGQPPQRKGKPAPPTWEQAQQARKQASDALDVLERRTKALALDTRLADPEMVAAARELIAAAKTELGGQAWQVLLAQQLKSIQPVVNVPPAQVHVPAPIVNVAAPAPAPAQKAPRAFEVTARDADGRVRQWREIPQDPS